MKKLLFLASFVFETGKIEYKDNQLVMVTDRDVQRFTEKQKALNPEKGQTQPFEHYDAAYDVFRTWFEEVFPESTLKHIMCKRPVQSGLFFPKTENKALSDLIDFGNYLLHRHGNVSYTSEAEYFDWRNNPNWKEMVNKEPTKPDTESMFNHGGWHNPEEIPANGTEYETDQVLIDVDGYRKMFAIGYYDKIEKDWVVYSHREYLDLTHMRWTNLPLASRDKK